MKVKTFTYACIIHPKMELRPEILRVVPSQLLLIPIKVTIDVATLFIITLLLFRVLTSKPGKRDPTSEI